MRSPARLGFLLAACFLVASFTRADPAPSQPIPSVVLRDGRVLHNVKMMVSEEDSIIVHADEGLLKIMKSNLPPGLAAPVPGKAAGPAPEPGLVMIPFNPNQAEAQPQEARPAPKVSPVSRVPIPPTAPIINPVFNGCTIVSFQMKAFQNVLGCAEVVIRNDTDSPVLIVPRDIVCVTSKGQRRGGRNMVTDGFPPQVKRREFVPAQGQIDDIVTFTNEALEVAAVQWSK
jgi:hypothetical protein